MLKRGLGVSNRMGVTWQDAQGESVLQIINTGSTAASIITALKAASNADFYEFFESGLTLRPIMLTTTAYPTVRISAQLNFTDGTGSRATLVVPAPLSSIFLTDGVTVDPADPLITAIIGAATGTLLTGAGNVVTAFTGGQMMPQSFSGIRSFTP